jgi:glutamyl-tRNA synthetase
MSFINNPFPSYLHAFQQTEFEETILEDLQLLGLHGDQITHTSDYFDHLYKCALEIINRGKAYADDTEQMQVRPL